MALSVPCELCAGSGVRPLTQLEQATLDAVGSSWSASQQIQQRLPEQLRPTALCNRLAKLHAMGLLMRRPINRQKFEWRRAAGSLHR